MTEIKISPHWLQREVEEQTEAMRRSLQTKPHHVTEDEMAAMTKQALRRWKK